MPTSTLVFTTWSNDFSTEAGPSLYIPVDIVGDPDTVLSDGSDSTYIETNPSIGDNFSAGDAWADVEPLILPSGATVTAVRVRMRMALVPNGISVPWGIEGSFVLWMPTSGADVAPNPPATLLFTRYTQVVNRTTSAFFNIVPTHPGYVEDDPGWTVLEPGDEDWLAALASGNARAYVDLYTENENPQVRLSQVEFEIDYTEPPPGLKLKLNDGMWVRCGTDEGIGRFKIKSNDGSWWVAAEDPGETDPGALLSVSAFVRTAIVLNSPDFGGRTTHVYFMSPDVTTRYLSLGESKVKPLGVPVNYSLTVDTTGPTEATSIGDGWSSSDDFGTLIVVEDGVDALISGDYVAYVLGSGIGTHRVYDFTVTFVCENATIYFTPDSMDVAPSRLIGMPTGGVTDPDIVGGTTAINDASDATYIDFFNVTNPTDNALPVVITPVIPSFNPAELKLKLEDGSWGHATYLIPWVPDIFPSSGTEGDPEDETYPADDLYPS